MTHKSGFVNILGNPNVGKSTIMNVLVGENLSIITSKAQTTRHRIMGIVNGEDFQIIYSDTPGIIKPIYKLHESMMKFVNMALSDADIILYVTDFEEDISTEHEYIKKIDQLAIPVILLINKIDLAEHQEQVENLIAKWHEALPSAIIIPLSAKKKFNITAVFEKVLELLPEFPPYYSKDVLTDKSERFFASEIIRQKVLVNYQKEIPYSAEVEIEDFNDEDILRIRAVIHVMRDTQKGIIIGKQGLALKKTATAARLELEHFFGKKVFLEMFVKVNKDWRTKDLQLKRFGYK
jgi:GTPase